MDIEVIIEAVHREIISSKLYALADKNPDYRKKYYDNFYKFLILEYALEKGLIKPQAGESDDKFGARVIDFIKSNGRSTEEFVEYEDLCDLIFASKEVGLTDESARLKAVLKKKGGHYDENQSWFIAPSKRKRPYDGEKKTDKSDQIGELEKELERLKQNLPQEPYKPSTTTNYKFSSPAEIAEELRKTVLHQDAAIRSISVAAYDHLVRPPYVKKSNVLIVGPTGTGKTELSRQVSELLEVPFAEAKLSTKTSSGYIQDNLVNVFGELYRFRNNPNVQKSMIFLDEIDKLAEKHSASGGFGGLLQNELISWVEDADINAPIGLLHTFRVNSKNMLFVGAGAFVGLEDIISRRLGKGARNIGFRSEPSKLVREADRFRYVEELYQQMIPEDLVQYGLKPELVGRFPIITYTQPLDSIALINIMKNGRKSPFNQQLQLLQQGYGLSVTVDENVYRILSDAAQSLGTGARGLETVSNKLFQDVKFNINDLTKTRIIPFGKTKLHITGQMAYESLKDLLPKNYSI